MYKRRVFSDDVIRNDALQTLGVSPRTTKNRKFERMWRYIGFVLLIVSVVVDAYEEPLVNTKFGRIRGKWSKSAKNLSVANYLGIPYAQPPIGELRFKAPRPWNTSWPYVRDGTKDGSACIQILRSKAIEGKEDCLYLNVFVPSVPGMKEENGTVKFPVLVFVHGGGFISGSSNSKLFAPDYLTDHGVILVTLNYRLNVLGFFSTGNEASPGNYGIKDILLALRWVKENIEDFQGDPNSVTLMGHSAGAGAVHLLALSNKTEGLFNKYILQSGSGLAPWSVHSRRAIRKSSLRIARILGCHPTARNNESETVESNKENAENATSHVDDYDSYTKEDYEKIVTCMRFVSPKKILLTMAITQLVWRYNPMCVFGPTLEDESEEAIITMDPKTIVEQHLFRDMPLVIGVVHDEGLLKTIDMYVSSEARAQLIENFEAFIPYVLEYHEVIANVSEFCKALIDFYYDGNIKDGLVNNITMIAGDGIIRWPTFKTLELQKKVANASIYFYSFSYEGTFTHAFGSGRPVHYGVSHGDDLNYVFPMLNNKYADLMLHNTEADWTVINIMTELWTNFMKTGVPSAAMIPEWPDYRRYGEYFGIGNGGSPEVTVNDNFLPERMKFWKDLTESYTMDLAVLDPDTKNLIPGGDTEGGDSGGIVNCENLFLMCLSLVISQYCVSII